ncbi:putative ArsR family transcriptional regulator [Microbacterium sp. AK009]|uniref:helix-turn-helix transcriptional regulator n=1 Tax=Microbacterium sp. AK009 TaxID=2723068 RepID=UPI0015CB6426|nr:helix-turn-helix domain-containing protein [Microbacterium sp. AK009]NYF16941.1 putative ArsR family transcriptional regulator [Microbacterium sp. AK009]
MSGWTFMTNHAHVLIYVARDPGARVRDIADAVGITERTAQGILSDLVDAGYLRREKSGRRNRYECVEDLPLRHPIESDHLIGELLATLTKPGPRASGG